MNLVLLVQKNDTSEHDPDYRRFATDLGQVTGGPIPVLQVEPKAAPNDAYLLLDDDSLPSGDVDRALGRRLVVLNVAKSRLRDVLNTYQPAAAIERMDFFAWRTGGLGWFMGLKELGPSLGAIVGSIYPYDPYRPLLRNNPVGLVPFLADYLQSYDAKMKARPSGTR
jgi:hypothetical protein